MDAKPTTNSGTDRERVFEGLEAVGHHEGLEAVNRNEGLEAVPAEHQPIHELPGGKEHVTSRDIEPPAKQREKKFLGLSRRALLLTLVFITVVILGAVVGGVVGGLMIARNDRERDKNNLPLLHAQSKIAASNWTDDDHKSHKIVYLQNDNLYLVARRWSPDTSEWTTSNITNIMADRELNPVLPAAGAFLAASSSNFPGDFRNNVWYANDDDEIYATGVTDAMKDPDGWTDIYMGNPRRSTLSQSQLGATFRRCGDYGIECPGQWTITYRDTGGGVSITDSAEWSLDTIPDDSEIQYVNSSDILYGSTALAIKSFRYTRPYDINLLYLGSSDDIIQLGSAHNKTDFGRNIGETQETNEFSQFAGTAFDSGRQEMWLGLRRDGTVKRYSADLTDNWDDSTVAFLGGPGPSSSSSDADDDDPRWSSIAMAMDGWFYGIRIDDGRVYEYQKDGLYIDRFNYVSTVY